MQSRLLLIIICISLGSASLSQSYPRNYFRNPLDVPMELAANFGELRTNHWHMGLDIRTKQKENLRVYAAASGYISHVGIRSESFGRYIIISHPNGLSTLYAHLNDFFPALEDFIKEQQYKQESWRIELDFDAKRFPVVKGQFIAYSGNTGGSQGPHLHFEIRDTKSQRCLNPLLFGFPVLDEVSPDLVRLAIYDREKSTYDQVPVLLKLKKTDSGYIVPSAAVIKTGYRKLSFGIQATDRLSGSVNPNGIYSSQIYLNEQPGFGFTLDSIGYGETRYMNAHIDYKFRVNGGPYIQHISRLPGDHGHIYNNEKSNGVLELKDTTIYPVSIEVKDAEYNASVINFSIQYNDSLQIAGQLQPEAWFFPNQVNIFEKPAFEAYLPENALYDSVRIFYNPGQNTTANSISSLHQFISPTIPLHENITIKIKTGEVPDTLRKRLVIKRTGTGSFDLRTADYRDGWVMAKFDEFGNFQAFIDSIAPTINSPGQGDTIDLSKVNRIVFQPQDNFGVISEFRAELDGNWLRFTNDKSRSHIYEFDEKCPFGVHQLEVTAKDLAGNEVVKSWIFKRYPYTPPPKKKPVLKKKSTRKKTLTKKR